MSFKCKECGYESTETKAAAEIQEEGVMYELSVQNAKDLNRQVVKGEYATVTIPALELEIPCEAQRGTLNTIEGLLQQTGDHLLESMANNDMSVEQRGKITEFLVKLKKYQMADDEILPFDFILDDPSGNSFLENFLSPNEDPQMKIYHYTRTVIQNNLLGMIADDDDLLVGTQESHAKPELKGKGRGIEVSDKIMEKAWDPHGEVLGLPAVCSACSKPGEVKMLLTTIPHFRDVILIAFVCQFCGHKSNEVKAGGAISPSGRKYTLHNAHTDINRSVLKSETASVYIPELHLELASGTLGGKFTTIEGLLTDIESALKNNPFTHGGDSRESEDAIKWQTFFSDLEKMKEAQLPFTFILDDPLAASHIQNIYAPDDDPDLEVTDYPRTFEQDEELGLNDIKIEQD